MSKTTLREQGIKKSGSKKPWIAIIVIIIIVIIAAVIFLLPQPTPNEALVDDDAFLGPDDAKVVIVEFSDYQCPACKGAEERVKQMLTEFEGKIKFVYRDFPLTSIHPFAFRAAEASECAEDQGKFWEMHDILFQNQHALDLDSINGYAQTMGLDLEQFNECMDSRKYVGEISKDREDGRVAGVNSTPTFFINGQKYVGAPPVDQFRQIINAQLAAS